jgi:secreted PhoX family phosphatase
MPQSHEMQGPGAAAGSEDESGRLSRRTVLRGAAGAGAAGLAMSALAGTALAGPAMAATRENSRNTRGAAQDEAHDVTDGEAVVVHVRDVRTGELDVYRGTSHVRMTDRELAARLARAGK